MNCPKCGSKMVLRHTWIEHDGIGHLGGQIWICKSCFCVEPIKMPDFELTSYPLNANTKWEVVQ